MAPAECDDDDEFYEIPLTDQRVFGAGLKRKRVQFVPPSCAQDAPSRKNSTSLGGGSAAQRYLAIVLPKNVDTETFASTPTQVQSSSVLDTQQRLPTCDVCKLPIDATCAVIPHEASLAHQVCLQHSHPPSSLDRQSRGLNILQSYGWDPDSRTGLGATGEGIRYPIRASKKRDTAGLAVCDMSDDESKKKKKAVTKVEKLNPKEIRKREAESRRRGERLREMFYGNEDLEKYLGPG